MRHAGIDQATLLRLAASRLMSPRDVLAQPPMDLMEMLDQPMPAGGISAVPLQLPLLRTAACVDTHLPSTSISFLQPFKRHNS